MLVYKFCLAALLKQFISQSLSANPANPLCFRVLVSQPKNSAQPVFALADNEALTDKYMGIAMLWTHYISQRTAPIISENQSASEDIHSFRLRVHNKHKQVVEQYLKYVRQEADVIEKKGRELLVSCMRQSCICDCSCWLCTARSVATMMITLHA